MSKDQITEKEGEDRMMEKLIKNVDRETVFRMSDEMDYIPKQIASKTLAQNSAVSLTLFSFDKGEEISSHDSDGDAMVTVLEGIGQITIDGKEYILHSGESILMPAKKPHSVYAVERFKMFLTVVFPISVK